MLSPACRALSRSQQGDAAAPARAGRSSALAITRPYAAHPALDDYPWKGLTDGADQWGHTPAVGSVAQWVTTHVFRHGHVAYVTAVYDDASVDIAGYNLREDSQFPTLHLPRGGAIDTSNEE
jgi:CHAP domain